MGVVFFHKNQNLYHQIQWLPLQSTTLTHIHQHQTWMTSTTTTTRSITTKSYNQISTTTQTYFDPLNNPNPLDHHRSKRHQVGESKKRRNRGRDQGRYLDGGWWRWMVRKETTATTTNLSFTTHTRGRCCVAHCFLRSMLPTKHRSLHDQNPEKG